MTAQLVPQTSILAMIGALVAAPSAVAQQTYTQPGPIPQPPGFEGRIAPSVSQSVPSWPARTVAPAGAPNILVIMADDVGFATRTTFGGPVPTPNLARLAAEGIRYNQFHTTAMCSPSRAALLTGRNAHAVGSGKIVDFSAGYPGYTGTIPDSAATIARILRDNGYNTAMFGKHHNLPSWEASAAGPFKHWPTGLGFEYFYGFIIGDTDQWHPILYRNTLRVPDAAPAPGQTLDSELADDAIGWIHQQKAAAPDKPFFIYYAPGSGHAPQQAPADWIARFQGQFDMGWDELRKQTLARQVREGIVPRGTRLTPRPEGLPAWDSLTPDQKRVNARYMEVFAAMIAYQDAQLGRIIDELGRMGLRDNTLVVMIEGDNGAEAQGRDGTLNYIAAHLGFKLDDQQAVAAMPDMGGPRTYQLYSSAWAWSLDTPFQYVKAIASHLGGTRNGLIVSWPETIKPGPVRSQFTHINDIAPTILDLLHIAPPETVDGVKQLPMDGVSFAYTFTDPRAPERHHRQYFEMQGNRAIYDDGWLANTTPRRLPWTRTTPSKDPYSEYRWELYDLRRDFSQSTDLAARNPGKLEQLKSLWLQEAVRNNVLPLDDGQGDGLRRQRELSEAAHPDGRFVYWGKGLTVNEHAGPPLASHSFRITADVTIQAARTTGVIAAYGSWFGGWSFYLRDGRPVATLAINQTAADTTVLSGAEELPPGPARLTFAFDYDGGGPGKGGTIRILAGDRQLASARVEQSIIAPAGQGETFDVGLDSGVPVTDDYPRLGRFAGDLSRLVVQVAKSGVVPSQ